MKFKANLHFHSKDDPEDNLNYTFFEGVDKAAELGFSVLALTCHKKLVNLPEYRAYAESKNILFVPGVELNIRQRHVVVLNPDQTIEGVSSFKELRAYKKSHPEIFILAPHPYFYGNYSLKKHLEKNIDLFDAIELSWFYSKWFNRNIKAERVAKKRNLPFFATSDTHNLKYLETCYAVIEAKEKTIPAIFEAIRAGKFTNFTNPRKFWKEMVWEVGRWQIHGLLKNRPKERLDSKK